MFKDFLKSSVRNDIFIAGDQTYQASSVGTAYAAAMQLKGPF